MHQMAICGASQLSDDMPVAVKDPELCIALMLIKLQVFVKAFFADFMV